MGWLLFLSLCVMPFHFPTFISSFEPLCNHDDAFALLRFKNSFSLNSSSSSYCDETDYSSQPSYPKTKSWENGTNCCLWDGVNCDTKLGRVIGIDLSCSLLQGQLHPNSTLFQLTHLQRLNLAFNDFLESPIFPGFGDLVALTHLNLSSSGFHGVIPSKISHLSKLVSLDLSYLYPMRFEPSTLEKFIVNVTGLRELALDWLDMSSIKPSSLSLLLNFSSSLVSLSLHETGLQGKLANNLLCLPNLRKLDLSRNENLEGELPKFNWSTPLRYLDLSTTAFSGKVSNSISHLKSLNYLDLRGSNFEGPILLFLSNLTQLKYLFLGGNKFSGEIPLSFSYLQNLTHIDLSNFKFEAPFPSCLASLGNMTQLNYLSLESNNFSGEIPDLFGKLNKLEYLFLSGNNLVGQLPSSLFGLTQLYFLLCSDNKLVGPIPDKISGLSKLAYLDLSNNLLNGTIPHWCFSLPSLYELSLGGNQLTGPIGEFSAYSMRSCDLSYNKLQGDIPNSVFDLHNLSYLRLSSNNLSGLVYFHKFSKLQLLTLDLSHNSFLSVSFDNGVDHTFPNLQRLFLSSCNINSFSKFLCRLRNLHALDLSNNQIHGRIPKCFSNVGKGSLSYLDLSHNHLTSVEYLLLSQRKNVYYIDLSFNMLEADIPIPPFGTEFFSVSHNKLTGDISSTICNASSLVILNLSHNNLTGKLPQCLGTFPNLTVLDLQRNNLFGIIPRTYFEIQVLETMNLNGNQLKGPLPQSMVKCKQLKVLDLGENNIEDTFPSWLESLQELQVLVLRANRFYGAVTCSRANNTFSNLRIFDVSNNNFNGTLPTMCITNFKGMMVNVNDGLHYLTSKSYTQSYNDSVVVTIKGFNFELERILTAFTTIDLSNNKFEGYIPVIIGELKSLKGLNLSHNRIIGFIPQSIGGLENLEWLDLSSNKLVGGIPMALTNLDSLSFLNLSQNQLEGMIPTGKQFNTFQNDSYQRNPGLCGLPLTKSCHTDEEQSRDSAIHDKDEFRFDWKPVAIGYASGAVFGMLLGSIVFLIGKPQWLIKLVEDVANQGMRKKRQILNTKRRKKKELEQNTQKLWFGSC